MANNAADAWLDLSDVDDHLHTTGASDGGDFTGILAANGHVMDTGTSLLQALHTDIWQHGASGTGISTEITDGTTEETYFELDTQATSGSTVQKYIPINLSLDWTEICKFAAKHQIQTATSLAIKTGIGMETLAAADNNNRKIGAEICTTVNNNWFAASANGTTRSSSDTGQAMSTSKRAIIGVFNPDVPDLDIYIEDTVLYTKTSNLPTNNDANQPSRGAIARYSVKNNTAASRKFNFYGMRLIYAVDDSSLWF